jgi:hypothetical protein
MYTCPCCDTQFEPNEEFFIVEGNHCPHCGEYAAVESDSDDFDYDAWARALDYGDECT